MELATHCPSVLLGNKNVLGAGLVPASALVALSRGPLKGALEEEPAARNFRVHRKTSAALGSSARLTAEENALIALEEKACSCETHRAAAFSASPAVGGARVRIFLAQPGIFACPTCSRGLTVPRRSSARSSAAAFNPQKVAASHTRRRKHDVLNAIRHQRWCAGRSVTPLPCAVGSGVFAPPRRSPSSSASRVA